MNWSDLSTEAMAMGAFVLIFLVGGFILFARIGAKAEARRRLDRLEAKVRDSEPEATS